MSGNLILRFGSLESVEVTPPLSAPKDHKALV